MKSVVAIVGRPNVGKSTLFNYLTESRDAIVADRPGVTRDRQYGIVNYEDKTFMLIDTGGIGDEDHESEEIAVHMTEQSLQAAEEADILLWMLDARTGLTVTEQELAKRFRQIDKPTFLLINKSEGLDADLVTSEFYELGFSDIFTVSSVRGSGIKNMLEILGEHIEMAEEDEETDDDSLTISLLGRPNVGKSTLTNRILGEERVVVFDHPGTTRDSIRIPFERRDKKYTIIDTAGVRRKSKVDDELEKFSILKSFQAIQQADIILHLVDAKDGVTEQDMTLIGMVEASGKALMIIVNKWDGMEDSDKQWIKSQLQHKTTFVDYASYHYISALHGSGVGKLFETINKIEKSWQNLPSTSKLTEMLEHAVRAHPPQLVKGRRIKLRFAHFGGTQPIRVIIHGNQTESVPKNYKRYLSNYFRKALRLYSTPVLVEFKHSAQNNPYKDKKNELSQRQINKRRRMMKHVKGKK